MWDGVVGEGGGGGGGGGGNVCGGRLRWWRCGCVCFGWAGLGDYLYCVCMNEQGKVLVSERGCVNETFTQIKALLFCWKALT